MTEDEARAKVDELIKSVRVIFQEVSPLSPTNRKMILEARRDALIAEVVAGLVKPAAPMGFDSVVAHLRGFALFVRNDENVCTENDLIQRNVEERRTDMQGRSVATAARGYYWELICWIEKGN